MDTKALYKIGYGVYLIGAKKGEKINGQIANTIFQIAAEPPTIAVSINKNNLTWEYIHESKVFSASVLDNETPLPFIGQFGFKSGRDTNKFADVNYKIGVTGAPVVTDHTVSYLEVKVTQEVDAGTHTVFIGQLVDASVLSDKTTLTYEYYQQVKRGTTPKSAPSYHAPQKEEKEAPKMAKYKCTVCGYIYDPALGDADSGIKPGTAFESLPANWTCPICGAEKSQFEKID
jgi:flavin reductase (DIM6/NTAB) family NADH-FMN oxidoreductase RutF/rubredoxin